MSLYKIHIFNAKCTNVVPIFRLLISFSSFRQLDVSRHARLSLSRRHRVQIFGPITLKHPVRAATCTETTVTPENSRRVAWNRHTRRERVGEAENSSCPLAPRFIDNVIQIRRTENIPTSTTGPPLSYVTQGEMLKEKGGGRVVETHRDWGLVCKPLIPKLGVRPKRA